MNIPDESLNHVLNALREYLQGNSRDLATLRETSHSSEQRLGQLTAEVEILRQELQGIQQNNSELERSLQIQLAKAQGSNWTLIPANWRRSRNAPRRKIRR